MQRMARLPDSRAASSQAHLIKVALLPLPLQVEGLEGNPTIIEPAVGQVIADIYKTEKRGIWGGCTYCNLTRLLPTAVVRQSSTALAFLLAPCTPSHLLWVFVIGLCALDTVLIIKAVHQVATAGGSSAGSAGRGIGALCKAKRAHYLACSQNR